MQFDQLGRREFITLLGGAPLKSSARAHSIRRRSSPLQSLKGVRFSVYFRYDIWSETHSLK